jgi:hypothetical protein
MPIDDALEQLEGVPERILNKRFPETIHELARRYKDKFKINICENSDVLLNIEPLDMYKDIFGKEYFKLIYNFDLGYPLNIPLSNRYRSISLRTNNGLAWQNVNKFEDDLYGNYIVSGRHTRSAPVEIKKDLEKWFDKTEAFILKEIPELEEFVDKYANR